MRSSASDQQWVMFTKRTDDPKLAWIERRLLARGIPSRRNGESWHAPILEVPVEHETAAWALLAERIDVGRGARPYTRVIDEIADDHPIFSEDM